MPWSPHLCHPLSPAVGEASAPWRHSPEPFPSCLPSHCAPCWVSLLPSGLPNPFTNLVLHLFPDYLRAAWGQGLRVHPCVCSTWHRAWATKLGGLGSHWLFRQAGSLDAQEWGWKCRWKTCPKALRSTTPCCPLHGPGKDVNIRYIWPKINSMLKLLKSTTFLSSWYQWTLALVLGHVAMPGLLLCWLIHTFGKYLSTSFITLVAPYDQTSLPWLLG